MVYVVFNGCVNAVLVGLVGAEPPNLTFSPPASGHCYIDVSELANQIWDFFRYHNFSVRKAVIDFDFDKWEKEEEESRSRRFVLTSK